MAAFAATTTVGYGVLFYAYGVLLVPMEEDLGWSRSFLTGTFSVALVIGALLSVAIGRWLDRHHPRRLLLPGAALSTALVVAWATVHGRAAFAAVWAMLGVSQALLFYEPAFTVLTKWFAGAARHRAITAVTLLAGLASTIFAPLTALLERTLGWRGAVLVLAAILGAVTLPCFAVGLRRPDPADTNDGHDDHEHDEEVATAMPREAFADRRFWLITTAYLLSAITAFAVAVLLVAFLHERGLGNSAAGVVLGGVGLIQVVGRSTFARLSVRWSAIELGTAVMLAKAAGLALLLVVPGVGGVIVFVLVYGAANGLSTLTRATTVATLYGATHYGAISAVVAAISALGGAGAPFAVAAISDAVGDERPVWAGLAVLSIIAAITNARAGVTPVHSRPNE